MQKREAEEILGLYGIYSKNEIRKNFKKLLKKYHPDIPSSLSLEAKKIKTEKLIEAYKFLNELDVTEHLLCEIEE